MDKLDSEFLHPGREIPKGQLLFAEAKTYLLFRHNNLPELPDPELAAAITKLDELYQRDVSLGVPSKELEDQMYEVVYPLIRKHQVPPNE